MLSIFRQYSQDPYARHHFSKQTYYYITTDNIITVQLTDIKIIIENQPISLAATRIQHSHPFLPRFDPLGVFCNVKPVLEPRGFTAPNVVGKAGVLPKRLLLVVQDDPKTPTNKNTF